MAKLELRFDELKRRTRNAGIAAVNRTMSECVIHAKQHHAWRNRTGTLEGSIRIANFATPHARGVRGSWGSADVRYALRLERGFHGTDAAGRNVDAPAYPYLVPAAEAVYPRLAGYIKEAM